MNIQGKLTAIALLAGLIALASCKNDAPFDSDTLSDQRARSAQPDTIGPSPPYHREEPGSTPPGEEVKPGDDTTTVPPPPVIPEPFPLDDEKFVVEVAAPDSLDHRFLFLTFTSEREITCRSYSYIPIESSQSGFEYRLSDLPMVCEEKNEKAFSQVVIHPLQDGDTHFKILVGNKSFSGKITRSDNGIVISWPDESQFRFPVKVLTF